jgi:glycosyl transferase family 2
VSTTEVREEPPVTAPATVQGDDPEVSVVIPCLNEAPSVATVVAKAFAGLAAAGVRGEVIVADNGSTDGSPELAAAAGALVVHAPRRGYGSAYLAGLAAARGTYCVMADADDTYDLTRLEPFLAPLRDGSDLVLGSRFAGEIMPGAMPWTNRFIGNPILTGMLNLFFGVRVSDAHCGLRAVRRASLPAMGLASTGMEFASEMVIKSAKAGLRIDEVPIVYHPRVGETKLQRIPDAWRHVRFMLLHTSTYLFVVPGAAMLLAGLGTLVGTAIGPTAGAGPKLALAIAAAIVATVGAQVVQLGLSARTYAVLYLGESEPRLQRLWRRVRLEHGLLAGGLACVLGIAVALVGELDHRPDPPLGILGLTLVALGVQAVFGSFFLSMLGLRAAAPAPVQTTA